MLHSQYVCQMKHKGSRLTEEILDWVVKAQRNTALTAVLPHVLRTEEHPLFIFPKSHCVQWLPCSLHVLLTNLHVQIACYYHEFLRCHFPSNIWCPGWGKAPDLHQAQHETTAVDPSFGFTVQIFSTQPLLCLQGMFLGEI